MMNENKIRKHGRKELYFSGVNEVSRFIKLYGDLFLNASWAVSDEDRYLIRNRKLDNGKLLFQLIFMMRHDDMWQIEKDLQIKRKLVKFDFPKYGGNRKESIRFVC